MIRFFKRKPKEDTVSKVEHEQAMAELAADMAANHASNMAVERTRFQQELGIERDTVARLVSQKRALADRLNQIAALETPNCAHIGKRMARIARGEVQGREKQAAE